MNEETYEATGANDINEQIREHERKFQQPAVDNSCLPKPPTRIEKLGELYDLAIENVKKRLNHDQYEVINAPEADTAHQWDMQVIQTYLQETKRPERTIEESVIPTGSLYTSGHEQTWKFDEDNQYWIEVGAQNSPSPTPRVVDGSVIR